MNMRRRAGLSVVAMFMSVGLLTGCAEQPDAVGVGDGLCSVSILFHGRMYTESSTSSKTDDVIQIGRELGTAMMADCPTDADGPSDGSPDNPLTIYAIVGTPSTEAAYAPGLGLMRAEDDQ